MTLHAALQIVAKAARNETFGAAVRDSLTVGEADRIASAMVRATLPHAAAQRVANALDDARLEADGPGGFSSRV